MPSTYFNILQAVGVVANSVAGVNLVSVRRRPLQLDVVDPTPHVIVWPGEGAESLLEMQFGAPGQGAHAWWSYPVLVVLITAGNRVVESGLQAYMNLRENLRNALFRPLLGGIANVFSCQPIDPKAVFDLQAFVKGNYDICGWQLGVMAEENLLP
jgi:hypothetical protein